MDTSKIGRFHLPLCLLHDTSTYHVLMIQAKLSNFSSEGLMQTLSSVSVHMDSSPPPLLRFSPAQSNQYVTLKLCKHHRLPRVSEKTK